MATEDDLTSPLGLRPPRPRRRLAPLWLALPLVLLAAAGGGLAYALLPGPAQAPAPGPALAAVDTQRPPPETDAATTGSVVTAAARPEPRTRRTGGAKIIEVPDDSAIPAGDGEVVIRDVGMGSLALVEIAEEELLERTSRGMVPRTGSSGRRPLDAYARPFPPLPTGMPMVAIVVGGLGINADTTAAAIEDLPAEVTLAFAPYGPDLPRRVTDARRQGHELLLQLPMEPFDYPRQDPGPHTLLVSAAPAENRDRMNWLLSRFRTYVGVVNFMGARFTGEAAALNPVVADIGRRGLLYLDDGTSSRSRAAEAAASAQTPFLAADLSLDAVQEAAAIDRQLALLEERARGRAIAVATAFPVTIDRLREWSKSAAKRGIAIVPLTALVKQPRTASR